MQSDLLLPSWSWSSRRLTWTPEVADRVAWAGTAALLLVAPFEPIDAHLVLPGQTITTVEAAVITAVGLWLLSALAVGRRAVSRTPLTAPALTLGVILLVSAVAAPAYQINAVKFVGRFAAGLAVCFLAASAAATPARLLGLMRAAVATGLAIGVLALAEYFQVGTVLQWLRHFRDSSHSVGGTLRMSATLPYPTIASMYLELVFAYGLALLAEAVDRRRPLVTALLVGSLVIVGEAVILTLTRAGLVALAVAIAVVGGGLIVRRGFDRAVKTVALLSALVMACLILTWSGQPMWLRFTSEGQEGWYRASYTAPEFLRLRTNSFEQVPLGVRNDGRVTWRSDDDAEFFVSYHWLAADGSRVLQFDGVRTAFAQPVEPGESVTIPVGVHAPAVEGRYRLAWDIVQEHRLWFSTEGSVSAVTPVDVWGAPVTNAPFSWRTIAPPIANARLGRLALWRIAIGMLAARPWLGVGPDNFRLLYGAQAKLDHADPRVHTNNMYLEVFVGAGILGGAAFLWLLWRVVQNLAAGRSAEGTRYIAWLGVAAAVAVTLVHGMVDSFLTFTPTYVSIWIALGFAVSFGNVRGEAGHADRV